MKRTRVGRIARLWAVLPFVGKHIAKTFDVKRARIYVLKGGETGLALHGLCSIIARCFLGGREWHIDEDYEDAAERGADSDSTGAITVHIDRKGRFSMETENVDDWRDGLERWRDPAPGAAP